MGSHGRYVPPAYVPIGQSDTEPQDAVVSDSQVSLGSNNQEQWSSGICACCDNMQSCCVGLFCPCYLFAKNAEFLGSGTFAGSCLTHFVLWGLVNTVCCLLTDGMFFGLPGCFISCYACHYRKALRLKYNLPHHHGGFAPSFRPSKHYQACYWRQIDSNFNSAVKITNMLLIALEKQVIEPCNAMHHAKHYSCLPCRAYRHSLMEAPCGDLTTHFFCHPCAVCQEYREICERCGDPNYSDINLSIVTAPPVQKMEPASGE